MEKYLKAIKDTRKVIPDAEARYFGAKLTNNELVPSGNPRLGSMNFQAWFDSQKK